MSNFEHKNSNLCTDLNLCSISIESHDQIQEITFQINMRMWEIFSMAFIVIEGAYYEVISLETAQFNQSKWNTSILYRNNIFHECLYLSETQPKHLTCRKCQYSLEEMQNVCETWDLSALKEWYRIKMTLPKTQWIFYDAPENSSVN